MPSFKLARTTAKLRLQSHCYHITNILKTEEFKAFRKVFIRLHKNMHCAKSVTLGYPFIHWTEMYRPQLNSRTGVYDDMYRCQLSFVLEFSVLTMKAAQVWLDAWREVRWTLCSFFWDCQLFNSTEIHTRGCQKAVHSLPTPHMQFICSLFWKTLNQQRSMPLRDSDAYGSCARLRPQTVILTFAVQILVFVYWPHRFRCMVCWIRKLSYCWNMTIIPVS